MKLSEKKLGEAYRSKYHWSDSIFCIASLFILGFVAMASTAVVVYQYLHPVIPINAGLSTSTGISSMVNIPQHFTFNYDPTLTQTQLLANIEQDPFGAGTICTDGNGDRVEEGEQYEKTFSGCYVAQCTCIEGSSCNIIRRTCCIDKNGDECAIDSTDCPVLIEDADYECTCNEQGTTFTGCYGVSSGCGASSYCTVNGQQICAGDTFEKQGSDGCSVIKCECGGDCVPSAPPTCCPGDNGVLCALGATDCPKTSSEGKPITCTCGYDDDGGDPPQYQYLFSGCTDPNAPPPPCNGEGSCTINGETICNGETYESQGSSGCSSSTCVCDIDGGVVECVDNEPKCCPGDNGVTCAIGATDCPYTFSNGEAKICTCGYSDDGGNPAEYQFSYSNCYAADDPCNGQSSCTINGETICEGQTYQSPPGDVCQSSTCTCGGSCVNNEPKCCDDANGGQCDIGATNCPRVIDGGLYQCTCGYKETGTGGYKVTYRGCTTSN